MTLPEEEPLGDTGETHGSVIHSRWLWELLRPPSVAGNDELWIDRVQDALVASKGSAAVVDYVESYAIHSVSPLYVAAGTLEPGKPFVAIGFPGSRSTLQWLANGAMVTMDLLSSGDDNGGSIFPDVPASHASYTAQYNELKDEVIRNIADEAEIKRSVGPVHVFISGHSAGGAIATIAALDLLRNDGTLLGAMGVAEPVTLRVFGSTRAGHADVRARVSEGMATGKLDALHIRAHGDVFACMPPCALGFTPSLPERVVSVGEGADDADACDGEALRIVVILTLCFAAGLIMVAAACCGSVPGFASGKPWLWRLGLVFLSVLIVVVPFVVIVEDNNPKHTSVYQRLFDQYK